jgi:hypothetical protein
MFRAVSGKQIEKFSIRAVLWVNFFHTFVFVLGRLEGGLSPFTLLFLCYKRIFRGFFGSMILLLFLGLAWQFGRASLKAFLERF